MSEGGCVMIDIYVCESCSTGVEYNTDDTQEHNEFNRCKECFEKEEATI